MKIWKIPSVLKDFQVVISIFSGGRCIPLMWLFIFFEWTGRLLTGLYNPFETVGTAPGAIGNMIFPVVALVMLVFSLREQKKRKIVYQV